MRKEGGGPCALVVAHNPLSPLIAGEEGDEAAHATSPLAAGEEGEGGGSPHFWWVQRVRGEGRRLLGSCEGEASAAGHLHARCHLCRKRWPAVLSRGEWLLTGVG